MPSLLEACREHFSTDNLYEVLGVKKTASESEVKKGYHKVSLKVHPDRVPPEEKDSATVKFQTIGKVYCILSNKEKRAVYDETGEIDDEDDAIPQDRDWTAYWRLLFRKVTTDDIKDFEKNYKGSQEELDDLKTAYVEFKGDMEEILNNVMCSHTDDEPRFSKVIKDWIKAKEVPAFTKFTKETKKSKENRKRKAVQEAAEAEEMKEELGLKCDDSLKALIQKRQQSREQEMNGFFDQLEAKYAQPKKSKTDSKGKKKGKK
ncbi:dnaJ homolog subfamily C member 9-like isoform X2 [Mercenaria mercenaria]|uniref:dnaJ homolog subfamily C member 9-like isoform X2 n=1 Tax=Mercenaria mercenaria TaxID=6596 RepID=UPI00234F7DBD|nr:dnaJ homolog subfamily C member 9-like isoform X2 [Mercenaria mercenaria]